MTRITKTENLNFNKILSLELGIHTQPLISKNPLKYTVNYMDKYFLQWENGNHQFNNLGVWVILIYRYKSKF